MEQPEVEFSTLFPYLSEEARKEVGDFLEGYAEIALRIFERLESERKRTFDDETVET